MDTVKRICPVCGTEYQANPTRLKHGRQTTCSRACSYQQRAAIRENSQQFECAVCGQSFTRPQSKIARTKYAVVCSLPCLYKGRSLGIIKRVVTKPYNVSSAGREAWRKSGEARRGRRLRKPPIVFRCETCSRRVVISRGKISPGRRFRFCSHDCANKANRGSGNPAWRGGHPTYYGPDWRAVRRAARIRDNYTCRRCGKEMNPPHRAPDVHHIKPVSWFADRNDANTIDNVVTLCHPCHQWTEWNGIDFPL